MFKYKHTTCMLMVDDSSVRVSKNTLERLKDYRDSVQDNTPGSMTLNDALIVLLDEADA